jgi:choline dehydrogenase-like flavoprotein
MATDQAIGADVCVIGCGPAGITVASLLVAAGARVVALETGSQEASPEAAELAAGQATGPVIKDYDGYLAESRQFRVGGAGAGWGSRGRMWCIPFCPLDFERRDWVSDSGWPISAEELQPYADRVSAMLGLPPFARPVLLADSDQAGGEVLSYAYYYPPDSGVFLRTFGELVAGRRCTVLLGTTAVELTRRRERVTAVRAVRADGSRCTVEADQFVLAAGGIESARMLLHDASLAGREPPPALGRYFMEHFHVYAGKVSFPDASAWAEYLDTQIEPGTGHGWMRVLGLRASRQRRERLLNATVQLVGPPGPGGAVDLLVRAEQEPNPLSRVELARERDRLGRPRARLTWLSTELDWDSVVRTASIVTECLERSFGARAELAIRADQPWPWPPCGPGGPAGSALPTWGHHHMGTTRMHPDPEHGVVDADCRVHGTGNLFVASSSMFPTSGFANPTFTIAALAHRLAEHLTRSSPAPMPGRPSAAPW